MLSSLTEDNGLNGTDQLNEIQGRAVLGARLLSSLLLEAQLMQKVAARLQARSPIEFSLVAGNFREAGRRNKAGPSVLWRKNKRDISPPKKKGSPLSPARGSLKAGPEAACLPQPPDKDLSGCC